MASSRFPIPQGTLDMLILQVVALEPRTVMASRSGSSSKEAVQ